jgi:hypothetical protein
MKLLFWKKILQRCYVSAHSHILHNLILYFPFELGRVVKPGVKHGLSTAKTSVLHHGDIPLLLYLLDISC